MKKAKALIAVLMVLCTMFAVTTSASAQTVTVTGANGTTTTFGSDEFTVKYNGEAVEFPDAQPFTDSNSRTLVPVRFVAETMGAAVSWDQDAQAATIEKDGITVVIALGSQDITVTQDGTTETVSMDTQAVLKDSRTYVPIRFVAEALGAWVGYSDLFSTVQIYDDVLTPDEIDRLHSYYDMSYAEDLASRGESVDEVLVDLNNAVYPQLSYFSGEYGFENANEWKLRNPNGIESIKEYKGLISGQVFTFGTQNDIDFSSLILAEARGVESDINSTGKIKISLRTDLSCVYFSKHSSSGSTYVRGVLTVEIPENADISWIENNFDIISNPTAGETRVIDVEICVNTSTTDVHWGQLNLLG